MFVTTDSKKFNKSWLNITTSLRLGMHPGIDEPYIPPNIKP